MTAFADNIDSDGSRRPLTGEYPFRTKRVITFAGATTDAWGDDGGALDAGVMFTVTGLIQAKLVARCTDSLLSDGAATLSVGISGATAIFLPVETSTQIDSGQVWVNDASNVTYIDIGLESAATGNVPEYLLNGNDIIMTIAGGANVTGGTLEFFLIWKPLSDDASVVATTT